MQPDSLDLVLGEIEPPAQSLAERLHEACAHGDVQAAMRNQDRAAIRQIMKARGTQETRRASAPAALPPPGLAQSSQPTELPEMPETISFLRSSPLGIRL